MCLCRKARFSLITAVFSVIGRTNLLRSMLKMRRALSKLGNTSKRIVPRVKRD